MIKFGTTFCLLFLIQEIAADDVYTIEKLLKNLPEVNAIDNFNECKERNDLYCHAEYKLIPHEIYQYEWNNIIQEQAKERFKSIRQIYRRAICVPRSLQFNTTEKYDYVEKLFINKEVDSKYYRAELVYLRCQEKYDFPLTTYDKILIFLLVSYTFYVIFATAMDYSNTSVREKDQKHIYYFSVIYNYENMFAENKNPEYLKLKCIQGLRCLNSILVAFCHWGLLLSHSYFDGRDYNLHIAKFKPFLAAGELITIYSVQFFLMTSAWLATVQTLKMLSFKKDSLTLRSIFEKLRARVLRLLPCVIVLVMCTMSNFSLNLFPGSIHEFLHVSNSNCRKNWWATLLFINNEVYPRDICLVHTWYLSADFQLYVVTFLLLYFFNKFGINIFKLVNILFIVIAWNSFTIYNKKLYHRFIQDENLGFRDLTIGNMYYSHLSTISSLPTTLLGIIFGTFFHFNNKIQIKNTVKNNVIFLIVFTIVFGTFLILGCKINYTRTETAIVGCLLKPLYSTAMGIAILGMSYNLGGPVKKFFECNFLEYMSHSSYVFYLYHFIFVYSLSNKTLYYYKSFVVHSIIWTIIVYVFSFCLSIVLEKPWEHVLKDYLSSSKKVKKT